jgi:hypothetical protein
VLLDQPFDLQERREQIPLILRGIDGIGERLAVVERLQQSIKGINPPSRGVAGRQSLYVFLAIVLLVSRSFYVLNRASCYRALWLR